MIAMTTSVCRSLKALKGCPLRVNVQLNEKCLRQGIFALQSSESRHNKLQ